ncbi:cyclic peptide export ABC transporter [Xanthomonas campestris pv. campestris]
MSLIGYLFKRSRVAMIFVAAGAMLSGLASAGLVAVIGNAATGGPSAVLASLFFSLCLAYVVTKSLSEVKLLRLTQDLVVQLRLDLGRKILSTSQRQLQSIGKDELTVILTRDIDSFSAAFQLLPRTFSNAIVMMACLGYMAWLSWIVFVLFTLGTAVCVGGYLLAERLPLRLLATAREKAQLLQGALRSLIEGSRELQLNSNRSRHFLDSVLGDRARQHSQLFTDSMAHYTWSTNIGNILFFQGIGILLFLAPMFVTEQRSVVVELAMVMLFVIRPIGEIMFAMPVLRQAEVAFDRVRRLDANLSSPAATAVRAQEASPFGEALQSLELRGVCHSYHADGDDRFLLGPVDLQVRPGESLFVIGGNGTGKTTLAMLLLGLYEPEGGAIALNGVPVDQSNREQYRQWFSAIFSDGHLFEHLPFADCDRTQATAEDYLRAMGLPDNVKIKDGRFSTVNLSMGQRKRLALIASYLEDRPIYLFDEWAADQDPVFKRVFYTEIAPNLKAKGKAVIIITHDDAYFSYADRIIKLNAGRLQPAVAKPA